MTTNDTQTPARAAPLLRVSGLSKSFKLRAKRPFARRDVVSAVSDVDLDVLPNESLGVVGESGCGKSTTARLIMQLIEPDAGQLWLEGRPLNREGGIGLREFRRSVQMVFQDSYASLNPRLSLEQAVMFGLRVNGFTLAAARARTHEMLASVGLPPADFATRLPSELSGGQRQRVNIARALAMNPKVIILDEAVSALDKSVEAQILALLQELKMAFGLTYIFISHDLNVVSWMSDRVAVMYLGRVVEIGRSEDVFERPSHPYTVGLLKSRLSMDPQVRISESALVGDPPSAINPPSGCRFRTRCPMAADVCAASIPQLQAAVAGRDHSVACHVCAPDSGHPLAGR